MYSGAIAYSHLLTVPCTQVERGELGCVCLIGTHALTCSLFFVHRLGGENLAVAQNAYVVSWFKGAELNMVFGLLLSVSRVVSWQ